MTERTKHPLILFSGFLGAGKTTFLRAVLEALALLKVPASVILNDFENADVDATLLRESSADIPPVIQSLSGNCLCCDSLDSFLEAVGSIDIAPGGVLLIEVNGTTDTIEMISALTVRPEAKMRFWSPLQVTVIDAQRWGKRGPQGALERDQLSTATHYFVSKGNTMSAADFNQVSLRVALGGPRAMETTPFQLAEELAAIISEDQAPPRAAMNTNPRRRPTSSFYAPPAKLSKHHHEGERAFTSLACNFTQRLWKEDLDRVLCALPDSVLRVKGLVQLWDDPAVPYSFQHVRPEAETAFIRLTGFDHIIASYGIEKVPMTTVIIGIRLPAREILEAFAPFCTTTPKLTTN